MAKTQELTEATSLTDGDIVYVVVDPNGTPLDRYSTAATLRDYIGAIQPGDNISNLTNDAGYVTSYTVTGLTDLGANWQHPLTAALGGTPTVGDVMQVASTDGTWANTTLEVTAPSGGGTDDQAAAEVPVTSSGWSQLTPATDDAQATFDYIDANWPSGSGSGDMSTSTYDPANIAQQLVGLTASQTLTNKQYSGASVLIDSDHGTPLAHPATGALDLSAVARSHVVVSVAADITGLTPPTALPTTNRKRMIRIDLVMDATGGYSVSNLDGDAAVTLSGNAPTIDTSANAGSTIYIETDSAGNWTLYGDNEITGTQDFNGQQVEGFVNKVVASVSGALTAADHSGNALVTSGNVTVPTTAGFNCVLIAGGAHTVTFNGTTSAAMAAGDLMSILVEDATIIHAVLTAAADKVSFS
jgi:hypothetical protein